jgi:predicted acylesterase/phospholipase RssA
MKPFRKNVAIAIDGGGIRGVMVARALMKLEAALGQPSNQIFQLSAGTSTGSIIAAGIGAGLNAGQLYELYLQMGEIIFKKSWRSLLWPLTRYRYSQDPLAEILYSVLGDMTMGDFWAQNPPFDVVLTTFDLLLNKTRFIKPWKEEYKVWPVTSAILASSCAPTYFPVMDGRLVDGGVGSYANPCYLAAYEAVYCLHWKPEETTLISLGTGRSGLTIQPGQPAKFWAWNWLDPTLGAFMSSAADQQVNLVETFFDKLDFRRFQVDLRESVALDDSAAIPLMASYGEKMGQMILRDQLDTAMGILPEQVTYKP